MLIAAGVLRIGTLLKYIPQPVITGFTSGIAVSIFSGQIKDLLGLHMNKVPADFFARWSAYYANLPTLSGVTVALAAGGMVVGRLTGRSVLRSGLRQLALGALAVGITFSVGSIIGGHVM